MNEIFPSQKVTFRQHSSDTSTLQGNINNHNKIQFLFPLSPDLQAIIYRTDASTAECSIELLSCTYSNENEKKLFPSRKKTEEKRTESKSDLVEYG